MPSKNYNREQPPNYSAINNNENDTVTLQYMVLETPKCLNFLRFLFVIVNFLICLIGAVFILIASLGLMYMHSIFDINDYQGIYIPVIFIVVGSALIFISIAACCFNPKHNFCGLYTYSFFQFLCFLCVIIGIIIFFTQSSTIENSFKNGFKNAIANYTSNHIEIDVVQEYLNCCGSNNYTDYFEIKWNGPKLQVPKSCCQVVEDQCTTTFLHPNQQNFDIFQIGCSQRVNSMISDGYPILISIGVGLSLIPLIGSILSCCLISMAKSTKVKLGYQRF